jgi:hypothetical protein
MVVDPNCPAIGLTTTDLFVPEPPNTKFVFGTKTVLLEVPEITKLAAGVTSSEIVKVKSLEAVPAHKLMLGKVETVGGKLSNIVTTKFCVVLTPYKSVAVTLTI